MMTVNVALTQAAQRPVMLEVRGLGHTYGVGAEAVHAIQDISMSVEEGTFFSIIGPSGCGKTTLLRSLTGLQTPTAGEVSLRGNRVTRPQHDIAVVFQDYGRSLFPWATVRRNIELPMKARGVTAAERTRRIGEALENVGLTEFANKHPWQLSGGMQQRVAIARALAYKADIVVMDEPFASVDAQTRAALEDLLLRVQEYYNLTIVFVTHDIDESIYLADRVLVLSHPPTTVLQELAVSLPRPRDQVQTKRLPEFVDMRTELFEAIGRPV